MKKYLSILLCAFCGFLLFAQDISGMEIEKTDVEKWTYDLFVKNNEKSARKKFKIAESEKLFYGAAEETDINFARLNAGLNAENSANAALSAELGLSSCSATFSNFKFVAEDKAESYYEDGSYCVQVFRLYKIDEAAWEKAKKDIVSSLNAYDSSSDKN